MFESVGLGSVGSGSDGKYIIIDCSINTNTNVVPFYFCRTRILEVEILARRVMCNKGTCSDKGLCEKQNNHPDKTTHILPKLSASKNFITKNLEGGSDNPKYSNA